MFIEHNFSGFRHTAMSQLYANSLEEEQVV